MADTTSTTQFKADISQLKSAMQAAQRQVRLASSEFQKATAGLDDWSSSAEGLQAKIKQLNSTLQSQKKQVELANAEWEKTVKVYGENSAEADRAKMKLNGYETALAKTEKQLKQYESDLKDCEEGTGKFADETVNLTDATKEATEGFTVMKGALANLVADGFRLAINAAKDFAKETLQTGMNFEQGMAQVQAVSGASGEELEALTEKAKEMGAKTKFSATESAEAFNYMAMAGWKTEDMLNGIEGIMNLAAASGADLATTSDIVTDALTAMGYSAGDAGKLADVMAAASSNANTNVEMMGQTFQYAAPIVGSLGYSMEDTAVAIGLMANAGIKGDKAGTALRSTLTRLSAPPKECAEAMEELGISLTDSEGNMKSLDEVMGDLRKAFKDMDETQQTANAKAIAGQEAMSGLLAIVNAAPEDYEKLTKAVKESEGAAESMANTMNDTVAGQMTLLKSQIEGVQIQIYEKLTPALRDGIDKVSESISAINWDSVGEKLGKFATNAINLFVKLIDNAEGIISVLKSMGTVLAATFVVNKITGFITTIAGMIKTFRTLKTAVEGATAAQKLLNLAQAATPIGMVTAAVAGLAAGLIYLAGKSKEAKTSTSQLTEEEQKQVEKVNELAKTYRDLNSARDEEVSSINTEYSYYKTLADELDNLVDANGQVKEGYEDRVNFILTTLNDAVGTEMELVDGVIQNYQDEKQAIYDLIEAKKAEAVLRANEELYTTAIQNQNEALQNYITSQDTLKQKTAEMEAAQKAYNDIMNTTTAEYAESHGMAYNLAAASQLLADEQKVLGEDFQKAKQAVGESRMSMDVAKRTYEDYQATIKNYEGLSSAIISGDTTKISQALLNMQYDFQTAETSTRDSLRRQVTNYEENLALLKQAIEDGTPGVTQEMVDQAEAMVEAAKEELNKLPSEAEEIANTGAMNFATALGSSSNINNVSANSAALRDSANQSLQPNGEEITAGNNFTTGFISGMKLQVKTVDSTAKGLSTNAVEALNEGQDAHSPSQATTTSGEYFGQGFINGMGNKEGSIWEKAYGLAKQALAGLKAGQKEGSPSKLTRQSGIFFGEGYNLGIDSMTKTVVKSAGTLATNAYNSLREAQQEGSPSKLTYKSGVNFTKGYINGIASMQKDLQKTVKFITGTALKTALNLKNYNFEQVAQNAADYMAKQLNDKSSYMIDKITYQNKKKLEDFDNTIKKLEAERDKKTSAIQTKIDATKDDKTKKALKDQKTALEKQYKALIDTQNKYETAYQSASSQMLTEFSTAVKEYSNQAQELINSTIKGVSDKYQAKYDELINKQETLISKLKGAGELFEISGAGVMTVNDIKEQTKAIKDYTDKLKQIKASVSEDLFDQIASYDMTEGSAFLDRLLAMSKEDLEAYNQAYTEKMEAAQKAGESIYKSDFSQVAKDYKTELKEAFKGLDKQLEDLGTQAMKGFVNGLTKNTDYMETEVKTFVKGMVDQFKSLLKIKSPSRIMMEIGDYTGEGFVNGLKNTINNVKKTAESMAQVVATPLDGLKTNIGSMKGSVGDSKGLGPQTTNVVNNYNLTQNNTSPKSLSALETYQARRQQIAMVKAMT